MSHIFEGLHENSMSNSKSLKPGKGKQLKHEPVAATKFCYDALSNNCGVLSLSWEKKVYGSVFLKVPIYLHERSNKHTKQEHTQHIFLMHLHMNVRAPGGNCYQAIDLPPKTPKVTCIVTMRWFRWEEGRLLQATCCARLNTRTPFCRSADSWGVEEQTSEPQVLSPKHVGRSSACVESCSFGHSPTSTQKRYRISLSVITQRDLSQVKSDNYKNGKQLSHPRCICS